MKLKTTDGGRSLMYTMAAEEKHWIMHNDVIRKNPIFFDLKWMR